jgi:ABC-type polysaccharide/polyol phosphate transport system ATPase subunit
VVVAKEAGVLFRFDRHRKVVTPIAARVRRKGPTHWGIRQVSFTLHDGEGIALLGPSGSGKTTILRLLARVYDPDEGTVDVRGRVGSLLSVDAGLLGLLTGRENALLLSALAGLTRGESRKALEGIKERSQLGDAFEHPVSAYSQGMRARLGLAVAEEADPDILVLDEVHEALDHEFRSILEKRARAMIDRGGIVVAAGHDHPMLERFCSRAIWMHDGHVVDDGRFSVVQSAYLETVANAE